MSNTVEVMNAGLPIVAPHAASSMSTTGRGQLPSVSFRNSSGSGAGFQGYDYQTHPAGTGGDSFTWNLDIPEDGTYQVFVRHPQVSGAATSAAYTVNHDGGSSTATVDQTTNAGGWVPWPTAPGTPRTATTWMPGCTSPARSRSSGTPPSAPGTRSRAPSTAEEGVEGLEALKNADHAIHDVEDLKAGAKAADNAAADTSTAAAQADKTPASTSVDLDAVRTVLARLGVRPGPLLASPAAGGSIPTFNGNRGLPRRTAGGLLPAVVSGVSDWPGSRVLGCPATVLRAGGQFQMSPIALTEHELATQPRPARLSSVRRTV
jgi:hypothetical protein